VFGVFVVYTGYPAAFALTGMLMLAALVPAIRDRTAVSRRPQASNPAIEDAGSYAADVTVPAVAITE
jgi:hypothetical protein